MMNNSAIVSEDFSIDDIHAIRYENYEKTKNMSCTELIEHTRKEAQYGLDFLRELKKNAPNI